MENWRAIQNFEGIYEVSDKGQVRRLAGRGCRKTRVLKPCPNGHGYMTVMLYKNGGRSYKIHQLVMLTFKGVPPLGFQIDHINNDRNDNRLDNLRFATRAQNRINAQKQHRQCSSQFKGVSRKKLKWRAVINHNKKHKHLGYFNDEESAAHAYDKAARELYGEFARTNF